MDTWGAAVGRLAEFCEDCTDFVEADRIVWVSEKVEGTMVDRARAIDDMTKWTGMVARRRWLGAIVS